MYTSLVYDDTALSEKKISSISPTVILSDLEVLEGIVRSISAKLNANLCSCPNVLVVDDNEFNRFLLIQMLARYGFKCRQV